MPTPLALHCCNEVIPTLERGIYAIRHYNRETDKCRRNQLVISAATQTLLLISHFIVVCFAVNHFFEISQPNAVASLGLAFVDKTAHTQLITVHLTIHVN
jgi:hypothetical protein